MSSLYFTRKSGYEKYEYENKTAYGFYFIFGIKSVRFKLWLSELCYCKMYGSNILSFID